MKLSGLIIRVIVLRNQANDDQDISTNFDSDIDNEVDNDDLFFKDFVQEMSKIFEGISQSK
jgi:hypothetical protein